jgi:hypothetical protein
MPRPFRRISGGSLTKGQFSGAQRTKILHM